MGIIDDDDIWRTWPNSKKSDLIHDFTMRNYDRANKQRDYGDGEICTPVEAHLLEKIYMSPGITVTQLAFRVNRSKSAISQIIKKLEKRGLVKKTPQLEHAKKLSLHLTPKGERLTMAHLSYDEFTAGAFFSKLAADFDDDTMSAFFRVLKRFLENMYPSAGYED